MANSLFENFTGLIINSSKTHAAPNTSSDNTNKNIKNEEDIKAKPDQDDLPVAKEPDSETEKDGSVSITSRLFDPIAKTNAYALIMVILLRDNAPDKILELISKLPFIGAAGFIGRIALDKPLKWLNQQIKEQGEAYIMENLVERWKANDITYDELAKKIESIPSVLFPDSIKSDAINLLNTYYLSISPLASGQIYTTEITSPDEIRRCKFCGTINKLTAKFCCECGHTLVKEKLCLKCNWILLPNFRFCPICGTKIPATEHKFLLHSITDVQQEGMLLYHDGEQHVSLPDKSGGRRQTEQPRNNYFWKLSTSLYESEKHNNGVTNTSLTFTNKSFLYIWKLIHENDGQIAKEIWDDLFPLLMDEYACFNLIDTILLQNYLSYYYYTKRCIYPKKKQDVVHKKHNIYWERLFY